MPFNKITKSIVNLCKICNIKPYHIRAVQNKLTETQRFTVDFLPILLCRTFYGKANQFQRHLVCYWSATYLAPEFRSRRKSVLCPPVSTRWIRLRLSQESNNKASTGIISEICYFWPCQYNTGIIMSRVVLVVFEPMAPTSQGGGIPCNLPSQG